MAWHRFMLFKMISYTFTYWADLYLLLNGVRSVLLPNEILKINNEIKYWFILDICKYCWDSQYSSPFKGILVAEEDCAEG